MRFFTLLAFLGGFVAVCPTLVHGQETGSSGASGASSGAEWGGSSDASSEASGASGATGASSGEWGGSSEASSEASGATGASSGEWSSSSGPTGSSTDSSGGSPSPGARPGVSSPGECGLETAKKAITDECSCGTSPCAKGKYCWVSPWAVCQDTAYPCGAEEQFCGNIGTLKMYKEDFKGCSDPTTCPKPPADDKRTKCAIMIAGNSEPGKCMAVCSVGYTKESQELLKTMNSCTDDEKKEWDETAEKNEAAYEASLSSGSAVAPTFAVAMTAAIVVFAALY